MINLQTDSVNLLYELATWRSLVGTATDSAEESGEGGGGGGLSLDLAAPEHPVLAAPQPQRPAREERAW